MTASQWQKCYSGAWWCLSLRGETRFHVQFEIESVLWRTVVADDWWQTVLYCARGPQKAKLRCAIIRRLKLSTLNNHLVLRVMSCLLNTHHGRWYTVDLLSGRQDDSSHRNTHTQHVRPLHCSAMISVSLWSPYVIGQTIMNDHIFILFLSFFLLFFPRLISAVGDWEFTILRHMVWLYCEFRMQVW